MAKDWVAQRCHHCDFSSGQRGMDMCSKCDGSGGLLVHIPTKSWYANTKAGWDQMVKDHGPQEE
jgi:hypothetical protein